jgi:hypothetical protein
MGPTGGASLLEANKSALDSAQVLKWPRTVEKRLPPQQSERDRKTNPGNHERSQTRQVQIFLQHKFEEYWR